MNLQPDLFDRLRQTVANINVVMTHLSSNRGCKFQDHDGEINPTRNMTTFNLWGCFCSNFGVSKPKKHNRYHHTIVWKNKSGLPKTILERWSTLFLWEAQILGCLRVQIGNLKSQGLTAPNPFRNENLNSEVGGSLGWYQGKNRVIERTILRHKSNQRIKRKNREWRKT